MAVKLEIAIGAIDKASGTIDKINGKMGKLGNVGGKVLKAGMLAGAAGIAVAGAAAFKFGNDFKKAENIIRVGTGATGDALGALYDDFKATFAETPADMKTVAQATADLNTRLELTGKPLQDMTKRFVELSRITGTDVSQNIKTVTRLFGDWDVATGDQAASLDRLFMTSQATGIGVDRLSDLVVQFGAPLRGFGFALDESTALLAKFEKEGVNTEAVMGGLKIGLGKVAAAGKDPAVELAKVSDAIQNAGTIGEANVAAIEMFGSRAGPDMAAAIREGRFAIDDLIAQMDAGGAGILETAKATETWQEKLQILRNRVLVKLEPLMVGLVDKVGELADWISDKLLPALEEWWGKHGPGVIDTVKGILRVAEDVGSKLKRTFLPPIRAVIDALRSISSDKQLVTAALIAIGVAVTAIVVPAFIAWAAATIAATWPLLAILAAVAGLSLGIMLLIEHWDEIKATVTEVIDKIVRKVESIPVIGQIFTATVRVITDKIAALKGVIQGLMAFVQELVTFVKAIFRGDWAAAWDSLKEMAKIALNLFLDFLQLTFIGTIRSVLSALNVWDLVKGAFNTARDNTIGAFQAVLDFITGIPAKLGTYGQTFYNAASGLFTRLANGAVAGINALIGVVEGGINYLIDQWNGMSWSLPSISTPMGKIGGGTISTPDIGRISIPRVPALEHGGYVERTGMAVVHEGERYSRGGGDIIIAGPVTIVTNDPEDFLRQLRRYAAA